MNADLVKKALEKVGNAHVLVNLVSRRVRQLNSGGGGLSRPLVAHTENVGAADIALREIIEGKMGWKMPELEAVTRPVNRRVKGIKPASRPIRTVTHPAIDAVAA
jgi:DNA-directed RNA polymerase subunit omega